MAEKKHKLKYKQYLIYYRYYLPGLTTMLGSVFLAIIMYGSVNSALELGDDLRKAESELREVSGKLKKLEFLTDGELERLQQITAASLPSEKPVFQVISALRNIAKESDVIISDLSTSPGSLATASGRIKTVSSKEKTKLEKFQTVDISMEISGGYGSLTTFFEELIRTNPLIDLRSFTVSSQARRDQDTQNRFTGEIELSAYWLPESSVQEQSKEVIDLSEKQKSVADQVSLFRTFDEKGNEL